MDDAIMNDEQPKEQYSTPELTVYGDVTRLTRGAGTSATPGDEMSSTDFVRVGTR